MHSLEAKKKNGYFIHLIYRTNLGCKGSLETRTSDAAVNTDLSGPIGESTVAQSSPSRHLFSSSESAKIIFISSPNAGDSHTNLSLPSNVLPKEGAVTRICQDNSEPTTIPDNSMNLLSSVKDCNLGGSKNAVASVVPRSSTLSSPASLSGHISEDVSGSPPVGSSVDISSEIIHIASSSAITSTNVPLTDRAHQQTDDSECVLFDNADISLPVLSSFSKPIDEDGFDKLQLESKIPKNATASKLAPSVIRTKSGSCSTYSGSQMETDLITTEKPEKTNIVGYQEERKDLCITVHSEKPHEGSAKVEIINKDVSEPHRCPGQDVHHNLNLDKISKKKDCMPKDKDKNANLSKTSSSQPGEVHKNTVKQRNLQVIEMHEKAASSHMIRDQKKKFSRKSVQKNAKYFCEDKEESAKIQISSDEHAEKDEKRDSLIENKFKSSLSSHSDSSKDKMDNKENFDCRSQSKQKNKKMFLQKGREGKKPEKRKESEGGQTVEVTDSEFTKGKDVKSKPLEEKGNLTGSSQCQDASGSNTAIKLVDSNNFENKSDCTSETIVTALVPSGRILEKQGALPEPCVIQASGTSNEQVQTDGFQVNGQKRVQVENEDETLSSLIQKHFSVASDDNHLNHIRIQGTEASLEPDTVKVFNKTNSQNAASSDHRHLLLDTVIVSRDLELSVSTDTSDESSLSDYDIPFVVGTNTLQGEKEVCSKMDATKKVICSKNRKSTPHQIPSKKTRVADKTTVSFSCANRMEVSPAEYSLGSSTGYKFLCTDGSAAGDSNLQNLSEVHKTAGSIVWSPDKSLLDVSKLNQPISSRSFEAFLGIVENSVTSTCTKPARKMSNVKILDESSFSDDEAARDFTCFLNFAKNSKHFSQEPKPDVSQVGICKNGSSTSSAQLVINSHKPKSVTSELGVYENTTDCFPAVRLDTSLFEHSTVQTSLVPSTFSETSLSISPFSPSFSKETSLVQSSEEGIASEERFVKLIADVPDMDMQQQNRTEDVDDFHAASKQFRKSGSRGSKANMHVSKLQRDRNQPNEPACKSECLCVEKSGLRDGGDRWDKEQNILGDRIKQIEASCEKPDITQPGKPGSTANKGQCEKQSIKEGNSKLQDPLSGARCGSTRGRKRSASAPSVSSKVVESKCSFDVKEASLSFSDQKDIHQIRNVKKWELKCHFQETAVVLTKPARARFCELKDGEIESFHTSPTNTSSPPDKNSFSSFKGFSPEKGELVNVDGMQDHRSCSYLPTLHSHSSVCNFSWPEDAPFAELRENLLHKKQQNTERLALSNKRERVTDCVGESIRSRVANSSGSQLIEDTDDKDKKLKIVTALHNSLPNMLQVSTKEEQMNVPGKGKTSGRDEKGGTEGRYSHRNKRLSRESLKGVTIKKARLNSCPRDKQTLGAGSETEKYDDLYDDTKSDVMRGFIESQAKLHLLPKHIQERLNPSSNEICGSAEAGSSCVQHVEISLIRNSRNHAATCSEDSNNEGKEDQEEEGEAAKSEEFDDSFIVVDSEASNDGPVADHEKDTTTYDDSTDSSCARTRVYVSKIRAALSENESACCSETEQPNADDCDSDRKSKELDGNSKIARTDDHQRASNTDHGEDMKELLAERQSCLRYLGYWEEENADEKNDENRRAADTTDFILEDGGLGRVLDAEFVPLETEREDADNRDSGHGKDVGDCMEDYNVEKEEGSRLAGSETKGTTWYEFKQPKGRSAQAATNEDDDKPISQRTPDYFCGVASDINKPPSSGEGEEGSYGASRQLFSEQTNEKYMDEKTDEDCGGRLTSDEKEEEERGACDLSEEQVRLKDAQKDDDGADQTDNLTKDALTFKGKDMEDGECLHSDSSVSEDEVGRERIWAERGKMSTVTASLPSPRVPGFRRRWESIDCLSLGAGAESLGYLDELGVELSCPDANHTVTSKKHDAKATRNFRLDTSLQPSQAQEINVARTCNEKTFLLEPVPRNDNSRGHGRQSGRTSSIPINNVPDRTVGDKAQSKQKPKYRQCVSSSASDFQDQHRRLTHHRRPQERRHGCGAGGGGCFDAGDCRRSRSSACGCRRHGCDHDEQVSNSCRSRSSCPPRAPRHSEREHHNDQHHRYRSPRRHRDCSCCRREREKPTTSSKGSRSTEGQGRHARLVHGSEFSCKGEKCRCCAKKYPSGRSVCAARSRSRSPLRCRGRDCHCGLERHHGQSSSRTAKVVGRGHGRRKKKKRKATCC